MHRIGQILAEGRRMNNISLRRAVEETKIGARYLQALEQEDWDDIDGGYPNVRIFLRTYGDYLSLDGQALVDEFTRIYGEGQAESVLPPHANVVLPADRRPNWAPVLIAAVVLIFAVAYLYGSGGWKQDSDETVKGPGTAPAPTVPQPKQPKVIVRKTPNATASKKPVYSGVNMEVKNVGADDCWVRLRQDGKVVFEGNILSGETKKLHGAKETSVLTAKPQQLQAKVNGRYFNLTKGSPSTTFFGPTGLKADSEFIQDRGGN